MKSCIRIPRVFLPKEGFETWAAPPCSAFSKPAFWEEFYRKLGGKPSSACCFVPDLFLDEGFDSARETEYTYLEDGVLERLNRGMILVVRTLKEGVRRGILACVDLEEYALDEKGASIRPLQDVDPALVSARMREREALVLEFPHAVLLYRDKKEKLIRSLDDDLELLYDIPLKEGSLSAYFIPEIDAIPLSRELISKADPCFLVADGAHEIAGAKAHWEEIKAALSPSERRNHPARFLLVEFLNGEDETVSFEPFHRKLKGIEPEAFCDYFSRKVKCKREGNILFPVLTGAESFQAADETIKEFLKQNTGSVEYSTDRPKELVEEDAAVVAFPALSAQDLFAAAKGGKRFPKRTFRLKGQRLCFEGREISYD